MPLLRPPKPFKSCPKSTTLSLLKTPNLRCSRTRPLSLSISMAASATWQPQKDGLTAICGLLEQHISPSPSVDKSQIWQQLQTYSQNPEFHNYLVFILARAEVLSIFTPPILICITSRVGFSFLSEFAIDRVFSRKFIFIFRVLCPVEVVVADELGLCVLL